MKRAWLLAIAVGALGLTAAMYVRETSASKLQPPVIHLVSELPNAVEIPPLPDRRTYLSLDTIPGLPTPGDFAIPAFIGDGRPFVVRLRLGAKGQQTASAEVRALTDEQFRQFGTSPHDLSGAAPGRLMGPCLAQSIDRTATGVECQRLDALRRGEAGIIVVIHDAELGADRLQVLEAALRDQRAPDGPVISRLATTAVGETATGNATEAALVARPGGRYVFDVTLPPNPTLVFCTGHESGHSAPARFQIREDGKLIFDTVETNDGFWHDYRLRLKADSGQTVRLAFEVLSTTSIPGDVRALWGNPRIESATSAPSVLLITVDALRPDHLSAYGYSRDTSPMLTKFASLGVKFDRAYTQVPSTWASMTSVLSGLYPIHNGIRIAGQPWPPTIQILPDMLARDGFESFAGGDAALFPRFSLTSFDRIELAPCLKHDCRRLEQGQLDGLIDVFSHRSTFAWIHIEDVHYPLEPTQPFRYDPGYRGRFAEELSKQEHLDNMTPDKVTAAEQRHIEALYDSSINDVDDKIRDILEILDHAHASNRTIVIITADHGENIGQHGVTLEHALPYLAALRVPLLISYPGHLPEGVTVSQPVELVDLVPTVLKLVGADIPDGLDGRDLVGVMNGTVAPRQFAYSEATGSIYSMIEGHYHLLVNPKHQKLVLPGPVNALFPEVALYDLHADPDETNDIANSNSQVAQSMEKRLHEYVAQMAKGAAQEGSMELGQAALESLQEAGYVREHMSDSSAHEDEGAGEDRSHRFESAPGVQMQENER